MSCVELLLKEWKALNISIAQSQPLWDSGHKCITSPSHQGPTLCTVGKFHLLYPLVSKQQDYIRQFILGGKQTEPKNPHKLNHELIVPE